MNNGTKYIFRVEPSHVPRVAGRYARRGKTKASLPVIATEPRVPCVRHDCATVCRKRDTIIQTGETIPCIKS